MFKRKQGKLVALLLAVMFLVTACGANKDEMVAIVDGEGVTIEEFKKDFESYKMIYEQQFGEGVLDQEIQEGFTLRESLRDEVLNKLIMEKLIAKDAKKRKISYTDDELAEQKDGYIEGFGGEEGFKEYLEENGLSEEDFNNDMETMLLNEKHKEVVMEEIEISDDKAEEYFEENKDELVKIQASHILVEEEGEAKEIKKQIDDGADFAKLAEEKSVDTSSAVEGGDLGFFPRGQMIAEFEEVAFELEEGEISDPVKTDVGFHIIKLVERKDSLDSLIDEIKEQLKEEEYLEIIDGLKEAANIEIIEENLEFINEDAEESEEVDEPEEVEEPEEQDKEEEESEENVEDEADEEPVEEDVEESEEDKKAND